MRALFLVLILSAVLLVGGCTVTETPSDSWQRIASSNQLQMRMMVEDFQNFWLLTKPEYTTPWAVRKGLPN